MRNNGFARIGIFLSGVAVGVAGCMAYASFEQFRILMIIFGVLGILGGTLAFGAWISLKFLKTGAGIGLEVMIHDNKLDAEKIRALGALVSSVRRRNQGEMPTITTVEQQPLGWLPQPMHFEVEDE